MNENYRASNFNVIIRPKNTILLAGFVRFIVRLVPRKVQRTAASELFCFFFERKVHFNNGRHLVPKQWHRQ